MESNGSSWLAAILTFFGGATIYAMIRSVINRLMVSSDVLQKRRLDALEASQLKLVDDLRTDRETLIGVARDVDWIKKSICERATRNSGA